MRRLIVAIFLFVCVAKSFCQNTIGIPSILNYSKTDFHGGGQTWAMQQDKDGHMYFANNEGLVSFDGTYWKIFPLPNRTIMRSIAIDGERIYAGGQGELGYFKADDNGFLHYFSLIDLLPKSQNKFADVWDIVLQGESVFFRASDRIFELKNNVVQVFNPKSEWIFLSVANNRVVAQDKGNGLLRFVENQWIPFFNNSLLEHEIVSGITSMSHDSLLITTIQKKSYILKNDSIGPSSFYQNISKLNTNFFKTIKLNETEIMAATTSEGCLVLDAKGGLVQKISTAEGLQNNNVLCLFVDREKNLWAGLNTGISMIAYNSSIKYIRPNKQNELSGFSTRIFNNKLYIGSSDGAYVVPISVDNKDLGFSKGDFNLIENSNGQVWHLDEVNQQILMNHNAGLFTIENNEAKMVSQDATWLSLPTSQVLPSNNILVGTYTGLKLLGFSNHSFLDLGNLLGIYESFRFLAMDNNDLIWASHPYRGVYQLQLSQDKKKYSAILFTEKDGLPSTLNNHVFKIKNRVVFATEKGVYEFDPASKKFIPSPFLSPIFGNTELRYLNEDNEGNIWFCSGKKIGVLDFKNTKMGGKKNSITYFPELTGQILSGFENVYPYNNENIFIGSERGTILLNYKKYLSNKTKPNVILSSVKIIKNSDSSIFGGYNYQTVDGKEKNHKNEAIYFPSTNNSFHFEFSTPNYGIQNNIEYRYKLEGYDLDWSAWVYKTEKDYTNLPYGSYTFLVKAQDNLGNESLPVSYSFHINPPFYKTTLAYLIYLLLFLLLIYLIKKWQKRSLYHQQVEYEEKQKQIIALHNLEIEKNEKEIIKLQNEKLANEVIIKNKELADASMHLIVGEDALNRVKNELQKLYKKSDNNHDVKTALQLLNGIEKNKSNWEQFSSHFNEISNDFLNKLKIKYPSLTNSDLKLCAYLQLNLSSKEIAQLMNISIRGVEMSRYRVRKKMEIPSDISLNEFFNGIV